MDGYIEALKLSISISKFAITERNMELRNDNTPIRYRKISYFEGFNDIKTLTEINNNHWDTYLNAPDEYILNLNN